MQKKELLTKWANNVTKAVEIGLLTKKQCWLSKIEMIAGPRAGALLLDGKFTSGDLLNGLLKDDCANLRQLIPWDFSGEPQVYMSGRYIRCEAGWSGDLMDSVIRLTDLGSRPVGSGRWIAGKTETGSTIVPILDDRTPHFLVSGQTGSGKSIALRNAVIQLSKDSKNRIVLIDGKYGESLKCLEYLPCIVAPAACDISDAAKAMSWISNKMVDSYENGSDNRYIVVFDEFQEFIEDKVIANLTRKIAAQGRGADVHLILATQHPTIEAFGDSSTRRNLTGKIALRVDDQAASKVAVGGTYPRADYLFGSGDSYLVSPGSCHRVQLAYVDNKDIDNHSREASWFFDEWPEVRIDGLDNLPKSRKVAFSDREIAEGIIAAIEDEGRPRLQERIELLGFPRPGSEKADRLLGRGRKIREYILASGYGFCLPAWLDRGSKEKIREESNNLEAFPTNQAGRQASLYEWNVIGE